MLSRVGDGSKTAVLIFQKMLDLGSLALKRNHSPGEVLRGMDRATEAVVASIRGQSKTANKDSLLQIARTAAGGNVTIARLVVDAFTKAGPDGVVVIEQGNRQKLH